MVLLIGVVALVGIIIFALVTNNEAEVSDTLAPTTGVPTDTVNVQSAPAVENSFGIITPEERVARDAAAAAALEATSTATSSDDTDSEDADQATSDQTDDDSVDVDVE